MDKEKQESVGYVLLNGRVGFINSRNKIFKSVNIEDVMDKFGEGIESMAKDLA